MKIHECRVYCYNQPPDLLDLIGKDETDDGKWMPFAFNLDLVDAVKIASDDDLKQTYNKTALFLQSGENYIIDTPYKKFINIWKEYLGSEESDSDDLEL